MEKTIALPHQPFIAMSLVATAIPWIRRQCAEPTVGNVMRENTMPIMRMLKMEVK